MRRRRLGKAGLAGLEVLAYGLRQDGLIVAAGNMTDSRGVHADAGVSTHPRVPRPWFSPTTGLALMAECEQLPTVQVVRYSAVQTNLASLAVAGSLGFVGQGENLAVRLNVA